MKTITLEQLKELLLELNKAFPRTKGTNGILLNENNELELNFLLEEVNTWWHATIEDEIDFDDISGSLKTIKNKVAEYYAKHFS